MESGGTRQHVKLPSPIPAVQSASFGLHAVIAIYVRLLVLKSQEGN